MSILADRQGTWSEAAAETPSSFTRDDVTFTSCGTTCAAWHYRPGDRSRGPLVVIAHGFNGVREQRLDAYAERFARAGLASLVFDYRHFGSSGGAPRQLFDNRAQLADWRAAIDCAMRLDGLNPERIALWGTSTSAGHVLALAAEDERIAAVVAQLPFVDGVAQLFMLPIGLSVRLLLAGLVDRIGSVFGAKPLLIPDSGPPGSFAAVTTSDALSGIRQITPANSTFRNRVVARFTLATPSYRPIRNAKHVRCPLLVCVADGDRLIARKPALKLAAVAPHAALRRYPFGHFAMYTGRAFDRVTADQAAFLREALTATAAVAEAPAVRRRSA